MNTFDTIVYKLMNIQNNIFSPKYDKSDKIGAIHKVFFGHYISNKNNKSKFKFLHETINNFYFLKKHEERNDFINYFHLVQKIYHTLNRFSYKYKVKHSKLVVDTDLQLNKISTYDKNIICIYHNESRYLFKIEDLLKIIYTALTNTYLFFSEPITIKNPYNNLPFGKSILYYIYFIIINRFKISYTKSSHIDIFLKFAECNFNMTKFINSYEHILRELSIKNYLNNTTKMQLKDDINKMIKGFNYSQSIRKQIVIDKEFPVDDLIRIMKPYLHLYLQYNYSLVPNLKIESKNRLYKKLYEFQKYNPSFGRKIVILNEKFINGKIKKFKSHIEFNIKHKKFNTYDNDNFMNNHLSYKYTDNNILEYEDQDYFNIAYQPIARNYNFLMQIIVEQNNESTNNQVDASNNVEEQVEESSDLETELEDEEYIYDEDLDEDSIS
jgi:hypothetical protein